MAIRVGAPVLQPAQRAAFSAGVEGEDRKARFQRGSGLAEPGGLGAACVIQARRQFARRLAEARAALASVENRQRSDDDAQRTTSVGMSEWVSTSIVWLPYTRRDSPLRACELM